MKTNFGTQLSRNEMKNVMGGKCAYQLACTCTSGSHKDDSTIRGSNTISGLLTCGADVAEYCGSGSSMDCYGGNGPQ